MTRTPWEEDFWRPDLAWTGQTVFIFASGPSLDSEVVDRVKGRPAIAVNSSFILAPWAEVLFFTDNHWFEQRSEAVAAWPGMVITLSRHAKREARDIVKRVRGETRPDFPPPGSSTVRQGRTSGQTAIGLAQARGAARAVLLGFDMRVVEGREHHHNEYAGEIRNLQIYADEFVPAFEGWDAEAKAVGFEILNATPGSALKEFRSIDLSEVLS